MLNPKGGNDNVNTPEYLAKYIVDYFNPSGFLLEPCKGSANFLKFMPSADWCELSEGKDFFDYKKENVDWVITNPPFSKIRKFLQHCYELKVKNIVFLCPTNHILGLKARIIDMMDGGYGIKEIILIKTPKEFPQSGFQWSINHIKKGYVGYIKITKI